MAIVCQKCGHSNGEGAQFCARPGCGEFVGWHTQIHTGTIVGSAAVKPGSHTQKASASVTLAATQLAAAPGGTATTTATVHNGGSQVEEFTIAVIGPAAPWAGVEPAVLHLYPGDHGECTIRITPPRHFSTRPGLAEFTVVARSTLNTALATGTTGVVDVGTFRALEAALVPQRSTGRWRTIHRIDLTNTGNVVEPVRIKAGDPTARIRFWTPPGEIPVAPGTRSLDVSVYPPRRWFGRAQQYPFEVTVTTAPPTTPLRLDGSREAVPLIAGWIPKLMTALAAAAVIALVVLALRPSSPSPQSPNNTAGTRPSTRVTAPPSPTVSTSAASAPPTVTAVYGGETVPVRGVGAPHVTRIDTGRFEVIFNTDMRACSYVATVGAQADQGVSDPGLVFTATDPQNNNGVSVQTENSAGIPTDYPFQLQGQCTGRGMWAVSNSAGHLVRGNDADRVNRVDLGEYEVIFHANMSNCAYVATIGDPADQNITTPGVIAIARGHDSVHGANDVYVKTRNLQGNPADYPFHLQTRCGTGGRWAVIGTTGNLARSNQISGAPTHIGQGQWEIAFEVDMTNCSYVAAVGIPSIAPTNPAEVTPVLVSTASGHNNTSAVYVETRLISGDLIDYPFHLETICP